MDDLIESLKNASTKTPFFSFDGLETFARVTDVYDGDTITVIFPVNGQMSKFHIRLLGINAAEMKNTCPIEKEKAIEARNRLIGLCCCKPKTNQFSSRKDIQEYFSMECYIVKIHCAGFDKYGRVLAHVYNESELNLSTTLLQEQLVQPYKG